MTGQMRLCRDVIFLEVVMIGGFSVEFEMSRGTVVLA